MLTTEDCIEEHLFKLQFNQCVRIKRQVEVYQWIETKEEGGEGEKDTYTYKKEWKTELIASHGYKKGTPDGK